MLKYLDIMQFTSEPDYLLKLNKKLLSGFFYQKACAAKKDGREICYHFHSYMLNSEIPEYDLIEYFGILIDNALEAISMGEHIDVTIDCVENHIHFSTRNSGFTLTSKDRENFFQKGYSSKPDGTAHSGIGLTRLRDALLHEHNGTLGLWNEGTDIVFELII
jgi:two-component system sensor histidine kinase AgrC